MHSAPTPFHSSYELLVITLTHVAQREQVISDLLNLISRIHRKVYNMPNGALLT